MLQSGQGWGTIEAAGGSQHSTVLTSVGTPALCVGAHTQCVMPPPTAQLCLHTLAHTVCLPRPLSPALLTCRRAGRGRSRCAASPQQWLQGQQGAPPRHHHQADGCTAHSRHAPRHGSASATQTHRYMGAAWDVSQSVSQPGGANCTDSLYEPHCRTTTADSCQLAANTLQWSRPDLWRHTHTAQLAPPAPPPSVKPSTHTPAAPPWPVPAR